MSGYSKDHRLEYAYTCPSPGRYPYQWFWDSCFHAVALSRLEPDWAQKELLSLVSVQRDDGFLPHTIFWQAGLPGHYWRYLQANSLLRPKITAYIQPPLLATAALQVYQITRDEEFGRHMLDVLRRYHHWLRTQRDPDDDGLISIVSPFESGMDWSPQFDGLFSSSFNARWLGPRALDLSHRLAHHETMHMLRRLDIEEIATNSIWFDAQRCLAELAEDLGDESTTAEECAGARKTEASLLDKCWDDEAGAFFSLSGQDEVKLRVSTVASLTPLLLDQLKPQQFASLLADIEDAGAYGSHYPLPSVAMSESTFRAKPGFFLWRGPAWINMNWLVIRGLLKHGQYDLAERLSMASASAVETSGFRECYQSHDGKGLGARNFGWSTLVVDMLELVS